MQKKRKEKRKANEKQWCVVEFDIYLCVNAGHLAERHGEGGPCRGGDGPEEGGGGGLIAVGYRVVGTRAR